MTKINYVFGWFSVDSLPKSLRIKLYHQTDRP